MFARFDNHPQTKHHLSEEFIPLFHFFNKKLFSHCIPYRPGLLQWRDEQYDERHARGEGSLLGQTVFVRCNAANCRVIGIILFKHHGVSTRDYIGTLLHECIHAAEMVRGIEDETDNHGNHFRNEVTRVVNLLKKVKLPLPFTHIHLYEDDIISDYFAHCLV